MFPPSPQRLRLPFHANRACEKKSAFSLIEVVLALALISFALLSMVGLLSTGLKSSRESGEDTSLAFCTETAQEILRSKGFLNALTQAAYATNDTIPDFYFDSAGCLQCDTNGLVLTASNSESLYGCTVTRVLPAVPPVQTTTNLLMLQLKFSWPLAAPATNRYQRIVPMSLANYE